MPTKNKENSFFTFAKKNPKTLLAVFAAIILLFYFFPMLLPTMLSKITFIPPEVFYGLLQTVTTVAITGAVVVPTYYKIVKPGMEKLKEMLELLETRKGTVQGNDPKEEREEELRFVELKEGEAKTKNLSAEEVQKINEFMKAMSSIKGNSQGDAYLFERAELEKIQEWLIKNIKSKNFSFDDLIETLRENTSGFQVDGKLVGGDGKVPEEDLLSKLTEEDVKILKKSFGDDLKVRKPGGPNPTTVRLSTF